MQADIKEADRFGLGVHMFQFLMEVYHPFIAGGSGAMTSDYVDLIRENPFPYDADNPNIRPHEDAPNYDQLPEEIKQLFSECFHPGGKLSLSRPTPEEWIETLTSQFSESGSEY
jgi:DNA-binding helix-hairpin-helix protein with protein kinase domain